MRKGHIFTTAPVSFPRPHSLTEETPPPGHTVMLAMFPLSGGRSCHILGLKWGLKSLLGRVSSVASFCQPRQSPLMVDPLQSWFVSICIVALHIGHSRREGHYRPCYLHQGLPNTLKGRPRGCVPSGNSAPPRFHVHRVSMGSRHSWQEHQHMSRCHLWKFYSLTNPHSKQTIKSWIQVDT